MSEDNFSQKKAPYFAPPEDSPRLDSFLSLFRIQTLSGIRFASHSPFLFVTRSAFRFPFLSGIRFAFRSPFLSAIRFAFRSLFLSVIHSAFRSLSLSEIHFPSAIRFAFRFLFLPAGISHLSLHKKHQEKKRALPQPQAYKLFFFFYFSLCFSKFFSSFLSFPPVPFSLTGT